MSQNKDVPLREVLTLQLFFMRIDILTVLPEMIEGMINCSIVKRAQDKGLAEIHLHNLRDYTTNKWRRVDDYPFGGEAGMVMQIEPIDRAISALKSEREYDEVIYMQLCVYACILTVSWLSAHLVVGGSMDVGQLTSMFSYIMMILMSLMMLSMVLVMIILARASAERITELG